MAKYKLFLWQIIKQHEVTLRCKVLSEEIHKQELLQQHRHLVQKHQTIR